MKNKKKKPSTILVNINMVQKGKKFYHELLLLLILVPNTINSQIVELISYYKNESSFKFFEFHALSRVR